MKIHALFGQRKCRYDGEYAPELLEACDQYTMEETPEWMEEKRTEHAKDSDIKELRMILIEISDVVIDRAFRPIETAGAATHSQ